MKKFYVVLLIFVCVVTITACTPAVNNADDTTYYDIIIDLDPVKGVMECNQTVLFTNTTNTDLNNIKFNLYPNAFRKNAKYKAVNEADRDVTYYGGESYGNIEIKSVNYEGIKSDFKIEGIDENILTINLPKTLNKGDKINLDIEYTVKFPKANFRFGKTSSGINGGNFYPILCVFQNGSWFEKPYYDIGDPFFSEIANYTVEINTTADGLIACSGNVVDEYNKDGVHTKIIDANLVRDFAFVYLDKGKRLFDRVDDIDIFYYYTNDTKPHASLYSAMNSIKCFNECFGKYPYSSYKVVSTDFAQGGMEYPNLVYINKNLKGLAREYTIAHETAHQWWYGVVGNNSVTEAWIDEGLAEFSSVLFYKKTNRNNLYNAFIDESKKNYIEQEKLLNDTEMKFDYNLNKPLSKFSCDIEYVISVYNKGQLMFASLYAMMGDNKFLKVLQNFYSNFKYKNATGKNLINCFQPEYKKLINMWLNGKIIIPSSFYSFACCNI